MCDILDHLLGNGGTAGGALIDGDHQVDSRGNGAFPVHALMFPEALVLQSNGGVDHIFGNVIIIHPDPVHIAMQAFHFNVVAIGVLTIENGGIAHLGRVEIHHRFIGDILEYVHSQRTADDTGSNNSQTQSNSQIVPYFREPLQPVWSCGFCHVQNLLLYRDTRQGLPGYENTRDFLPVQTRAQHFGKRPENSRFCRVNPIKSRPLYGSGYRGFRLKSDKGSC